MLHLFGYAAAVLVGASLGLIGAGGSILTVPILVYLFSIEPEAATSYSLFLVGATAAWGSIGFFRKKLINIPVGVIFAVPSFAGVYMARRVILPMIPLSVPVTSSWAITRGEIIMIVFAVIMLGAASSMIRKAKPKPKDGIHSPLMQNLKVMLSGFAVGSVAGFVGAGGGFLTIPALVLLLGLEMKAAVGTSLMIIAAQSLFGFFSTLNPDARPDWTFLLTFAFLAGLGIVVGTRLSRRVSGERLKPAFGWFVLVMGFYILGRELIKV